MRKGKRALSNAHIEGNRMRSKAYLPWALARQSSRSDIQASRAHSNDCRFAVIVVTPANSAIAGDRKRIKYPGLRLAQLLVT